MISFRLRGKSRCCIMSIINMKYCNCAEVCIRLFRKESIMINKQTVANKIENHPYRNSLLAIADLLNEHGIQTKPFILKDINELNAIDNSFIAQVSLNNNTYFCFILDITGEYLIWYNPLSLKKEKIKKKYFIEIHTGPILLYSVDKIINEEDYSYKSKAYKVKELIDKIPFLAAVILILLLLIFIYTGKLTNINHILYIIGLLGGVLISFSIVRYENGHDSFLSKKLCHIGPKVDCFSVLHSKASNIFGIEWSKIGFAYFTGILSLVIINCEDEYIFHHAAIFNLIALPYIVYSLYTQIFKVKRVCLMCITIIVILLYLITISITGNTDNSMHIDSNILVKDFLLYTFYSLIALWSVNIHTVLSDTEKKNKYNQTLINELKYNKHVFKSLLEQGTKIEEIPSDLTINIGNPIGNTRILKICNPYCIHCSMSHKELEKIIDSSEIYFQILFAPIQPLDDTKNNPIKLFLALRDKHDESFMHGVLKEWYNEKNKDYESFRKKFIISDALIEQQNQKLESLIEWCARNQIEYTPTFYINGYHLPDDYYTYKDLPFLFA